MKKALWIVMLPIKCTLIFHYEVNLCHTNLKKPKRIHIEEDAPVSGEPLAPYYTIYMKWVFDISTFHCQKLPSRSFIIFVWKKDKSDKRWIDY